MSTRWSTWGGLTAIVVFLLLVPAAGTSFAGQLTLAWNANSESNLAGYKLRVGNASRVYQTTIDVHNTTTYTVTGLTAGQVYYFTVTAYNTSGTESAYSAEVSGTVGSTPPPSGLVAAYGFEEGSGTTTGDGSGNGNAGTINGATWSAAGRFGKALSFDGTTSRVIVADAASLDLTNGMTLEAWLNPSVLSGYRSAILKETSTRLTYSLYAYDDGAKANSTINVGGTDQVAESGSALPLNTWTHLASTYDGTTLRVFVNGVQVSTLAVSGSMIPSTGPLSIGGNGVWGEFFSGLIDEVRVYNRALAASEIQADMTQAVVGGAPVDTTAPTVSLTAPAAGTVSGSVNVSANASDNVGVASVQFKLDGANLGALDTATPYTIAWDTTTATNGVHALTAVARDAAGNSTTSTAVSVTVSNDTTAPVISGVTASALTSSGATIGWTTNEASDSQVEYGLTTSYGTLTTLTASMVTTHSTSVTGLTDTTLYHYRVRSKDAAGNLAMSADATLTTRDGTAPTVSVTSPATGATVSASVTLSATASDNVGVAGVQFMLDGANLGAEDTATPYTMAWDTTTATSGAHTLTAVARDAAGNTKTSTAVSVTVSNDTTAPVISGVTASAMTSSGVTIGWTTNEASDSQVEYGLTTSYGTLTTLNTSMVTTHSTSVTGLTDTTLYHYRVRSKDAAGNLAMSADATFTTRDGTAPTVSVTSPATGATVSASVTLSASASDNVGVAGVQFLLDGANLGAEDTATPYTMAWDTTIATNGAHTLTAVARDAAGNTKTSTAVSVTVSNDTTAPVISGVTASAMTSSGATIGWTTNEASDSQAEYGLTTSYGTLTTLNPSMVTTHSLAVTGLADTTLYHYRVRSKDAAGNLAMSADATFTTRDGTAPTVSVTSPTAGATVSATITVSASASDNVGVAGVQFMLDGANLGTEDTATPYTMAWDTTTATSGAHTLTAVARDAAGNTRTSTAVSVTVSNDTTAPVISGVTASAMTSSGATIGWTTNEASDSQVEYGLTTSYGTLTTLNPSMVTTHSLAVTGLADTTLYHYRVRSKDAAGNLAMSADATFTTRDGTAPTVSVTSPTAGATVSASVTLSASASDNVGVAGVQFLLDGANLGAEDTATPYTMAWDTTTATSGAHTLTAVARDASGNTKTSTAVSVTVSNDTTAPVISGVTASAMTSSGATIGWTTNEASDSQVEYGLTTSYGTLTTLNASMVTTHSLAVTGLADTTLYHYRVRSKDAAGNLAMSADATFTTRDGTAPTVSVTSPATGATVSASVTVSATASDNVGVAGVQFMLDGANLGAEDTATPYTMTWDTTTATSGAHTLTAVARDAAGNTKTSTAVSVTVSNDTTAPVISGVTASAMTSSGATIGWTTNEASDSQVEYGLTTSYGTLTTLNTSMVTTHSTSVTGLTDTTLYHYRVRSKDAAGNLAMSADATFTTRDGTAPTVSVTSPTAGATVSATITVSASASDNVGVAGVQFMLDGANLGAEDTATPYTKTWDTTTATNGAHTLTAVARDAAGNTKTSTAVSVTVSNDITAPVISGVTASGMTSSGATIGWATSEASDSQVEYGLTTSYGTLTTLNASMVTTHSTSVTGLTDTTLYHYRVRSKDAGGNLAMSADATFTTRDGTAPTVSVTSPATGATVSATITMSATASDNVGVAGVQFMLDGTSLGAEDTATPYTKTWDTTTATNGAHTLTAVARDAAGNTKTSTAVSVTVSNDTTAPVISGVTVISTTTTGAAIGWTTTESSDSQVEYGLTASYGTLTTLNGSMVTTHSAAVSGLAEGTLYHYRVRSKDAAGNLAMSADATFTTRDVTAPTVSITSPTAGAVLTGTVTVSAAASDNVGVAGVQFKLDGTSLGAEDTATPYTTAWDTRTATNGVHTLAAVARDAAGNSTASSGVIVTVLNDLTPPALSHILISSISASGAMISWQSDEAGDSQIEYGLTTAYGSMSVLNGSLVLAHAGTLSGLAASSQYHFRVRSRDAAGNLATSADFTFGTRDGMPPSVSLVSPLNGSTVTATVSLQAAATDNVGVAGVSFNIDGVALGSELTSAPYTLAWDTTRLSDGAHVITAVARDAAGDATTSAGVSVVVANGILWLAPEDTSLNVDTTNYSNSTVLAAYTWPDYEVGTAIALKFDLSALPAGAVVNSAALSLALVESDAAAENTYNVSAHKIMSRQPVMSAATGYTADGVVAWTPNACCYNSAPLAQADISPAYDTVAVDKTAGYKTWNLTQVVQGWAAAPGTNKGIVLNPDTSLLKDHYRRFASMEYANPALRPFLRVSFTRPAASDTTPPTVSMTAPATGAAVTGLVTLSANASDNVGVAGVQFKVDGIAMGAERLAAPFTTTWDTSTAANGTHTISAVARDAAGNVTGSSPVSVTVANSVATLTPQDTYLNLDTTNYSTAATLQTYTWPDYQVANAILMKFDLSSLPAGAVVQEAVLSMALVTSDSTADPNYTITVHEIVGINPVLTGATGTKAGGGNNNWAPNTCCYNNTPLAQANISAPFATTVINKTPGFKTWTITEMVRDWLANPSTNAGLLLNSDVTALRDRFRYFASTENPNASLRPFLTIRYVQP